MWQKGTVHPTHDMANEISKRSESYDGNTLYAQELAIELGGSNARHGASIGYATQEENGLALAPGRSMLAVRSGNQSPEEVGYDNSLAWNAFGDEPETDRTTMDSQMQSAAAHKAKGLMGWGLAAIGVWWLWSRRQ